MNMIGKYLRIGNTKGTWSWRERGEQGKGGREGERQERGGETTCRIALVKKASAGQRGLEASLGFDIPCSQETECIAVLYDISRIKQYMW